MEETLPGSKKKSLSIVRHFRVSSLSLIDLPDTKKEKNLFEISDKEGTSTFLNRSLYFGFYLNIYIFFICV